MDEIDIRDEGKEPHEQDIHLEPQMNGNLLPLSRYEANVVNDLKQLKCGDVASFTYFGLNHWGIVSEVKFEIDPKVGKMRCIHYSTPSVLGIREVAEELFPINLNKKTVRRLQFDRFNTFPPEQVVARARKRVGEKKWNIKSNRSDHLCDWAKVKTEQMPISRRSSFESEGKTERSANLQLGKADVHLINEIEPGDVVEYGSDTGIIVEMQDLNEGRQFHIDVVTLKDGFPFIGRRMPYTIDLNKDHLVVHKYNPESCISMQERPRVSRALFSQYQCDEIEIKDLSELKTGDVVSISYYVKDHLIIISDVQLKDGIKRGRLCGIHYALPRLFDERVVAEEYFEINLEKNKITLLQFNTFNTFPSDEVVCRARKRVGEKKWHFLSNRSKHLCIWAKVKPDHLSEDNSQMEGRNGGFGGLNNVKKIGVHLMDEIQIGDVVKYGSDKGIVVQLVDKKECRIFDMNVVVLTSIFPAYARCVAHNIDLNKDDLTLYMYNPARCVTMEERAARASKMIDEECPRWRQNAFIEDIIRKPKDCN
ncbi:hypothetical protein CHS0354_017746 [Potamilus streckersoni]|uniref:Uncharacterized protein n=1 Tax=Potamilus streckersoni TaxID=2493646 RepID=A0AAE0S3T0_9BIVA|nr:hypothetical protein CHS0354_017746 [Potamilus streckersoni]